MFERIKNLLNKTGYDKILFGLPALFQVSVVKGKFILNLFEDKDTWFSQSGLGKEERFTEGYFKTKMTDPLRNLGIISNSKI